MAMRSRRPAHVRPRPPSDGRPRPRAPIRPAPPASGRLTGRRRLEPAGRLPLPASLLLAGAIVILGVAVLLTGTGLLGETVGGVGSAFRGVLERLAPSSATEAPSIAAGFDAPTLSPPARGATNQPTVDVRGTVPLLLAGTKGYTIRLYRVTHGAAPALVGEQPVGATSAFTFAAVPLVAGENDFAATLAGDGHETGQSAVVSYILDTTPPTIAIGAPKDGAVVATASLTIAGKTEPASALTARDEANAATANGTAAADGTFRLTIALAPGTNGITVRATDQAGNVTSTVLSVQRSTGQLLATLTAVPNRVSAKAGGTIVLTLHATAPDGSPVVGGSVTFAITIPGVAAVIQEATTDATGSATWPYILPPNAATVGLTGLATAQLTTATEGSAAPRAAITITP